MNAAERIVAYGGGGPVLGSITIGFVLLVIALAVARVRREGRRKNRNDDDNEQS